MNRISCTLGALLLLAMLDVGRTAAGDPPFEDQPAVVLRTAASHSYPADVRTADVLARDTQANRVPERDIRASDNRARIVEPPERLPPGERRLVAPSPGPPTADGKNLAAALGREELEALALANHPALARAAARASAAQGRWLQVGLWPNPAVGYQASEVGNNGRAGQQGWYLEQEWVTAGKLRVNRAVAAREIEQARAEWVATQLRVLTDVRLTYYQTLAAQRSVEVAQRLLAIGDDGVRVTTALFEAREGSRVDVLQARIEAQQAGITLENLRNRHQAAWYRLTAAVGVPQLVASPLAGALDEPGPDLAWDELIARLAAASPELAAARAAVARARWALERARIEPIPNVVAQGGAQYDDASQLTIANMQVGIEVPLFDRNQGDVRRTLGDLAAARAEVNRLELQLQRRLASAFERYLNARNQRERYAREIVPAAQQSLDLVQEGFREGEYSYLELLTVQRTYAQMNLAYIESLGEYWQSVALLEGLLLEGALEGP